MAANNGGDRISFFTLQVVQYYNLYFHTERHAWSGLANPDIETRRTIANKFMGQCHDMRKHMDVLIVVPFPSVATDFIPHLPTLSHIHAGVSGCQLA